MLRDLIHCKQAKKLLTRTEIQALAKIPEEDTREQCFWLAEQAYEMRMLHDHKEYPLSEIWSNFFIMHGQYRLARLSSFYAASDWLGYRKGNSLLEGDKREMWFRPTELSARGWWNYFYTREDEWRNNIGEWLGSLSIFGKRAYFDLEDKWVTDAEIELYCNSIKESYDGKEPYDWRPGMMNGYMQTPFERISNKSPDFYNTAATLAEIALASERTELFEEMLMRLQAMRSINHRKKQTPRIMCDSVVGFIEAISHLRKAADQESKQSAYEYIFTHIISYNRNEWRYISQCCLHNDKSTLCRHLYEYDMVTDKDEFLKYYGVYVMLGSRNIANQFVRDDIQFGSWISEDLPNVQEVLDHLCSIYPDPEAVDPNS